MASLKNSCNGFAFTIHSEGGRCHCVLNITDSDATAILVRNEATAKFEVDLNLCPPICPNLPYAEIYGTILNVDGAEPMIMLMQSGPNGDLWIRKDGPNHR